MVYYSHSEKRKEEAKMPRRNRNARPRYPGTQTVPEWFWKYLDRHPTPVGLGLIRRPTKKRPTKE